MLRTATATAGETPTAPNLNDVPAVSPLQQSAMLVARQLEASRQLDYLLVSSAALERAEGAFTVPESAALSYPGDAPIGSQNLHISPTSEGCFDLYSLALARWLRVPAGATAPPQYAIVPMVVIRREKPHIAKIFLIVEPGVAAPPLTSSHLASIDNTPIGGVTFLEREQP
jgi:hypothetical protein